MDDLHRALEDVTKGVKNLIELYCRTYHTDFRFESVTNVVKGTSHSKPEKTEENRRQIEGKCPACQTRVFFRSALLYSLSVKILLQKLFRKSVSDRRSRELDRAHRHSAQDSPEVVSEVRRLPRPLWTVPRRPEAESGDPHQSEADAVGRVPRHRHLGRVVSSGAGPGLGRGAAPWGDGYLFYLKRMICKNRQICACFKIFCWSEGRASQPLPPAPPLKWAVNENITIPVVSDEISCCCTSLLCRIQFENVLLCLLPREARLCFTLIGVKVYPAEQGQKINHVNTPLGWVAHQVFNHKL